MSSGGRRYSILRRFDFNHCKIAEIIKNSECRNWFVFCPGTNQSNARDLKEHQVYSNNTEVLRDYI